MEQILKQALLDGMEIVDGDVSIYLRYNTLCCWYNGVEFSTHGPYDQDIIDVEKIAVALAKKTGLTIKATFTTEQLKKFARKED